MIKYLIILLIFVGCEPLGYFGSGDRRTVAVYENDFIPVVLRVNPAFSRIRASRGNFGQLEVFVEFLDQFDDSIKALGLMQFDLYRWQSGSSDPRGSAISATIPPVDISTVSLSQHYWDHITGHYRFVIDLPEEAANLKVIVLQANCVLKNDTRLEGQAVVE